MPPSAIKGTPVLFETERQFMMAVIWGMPIPATMRVVQIEPGPTPILIPSTPALIKSSTPFSVPTLPAISSISL